MWRGQCLNFQELNLLKLLKMNKKIGFVFLLEYCFFLPIRVCVSCLEPGFNHLRLFPLLILDHFDYRGCRV